MNMMWRLGGCLAVASLFASPANAAPQNSPRAPKIKTSTELVMVPVIVHKHGVHLGGLKKEGFELLQDGKPQEIVVFEEVHARAETFGVRPEAQEFTNVRYGQGAERLTVIAVDLVNTAPLDQLYMKQEIIKFLESAAGSEETYCLVAITTHGIHVLRDFTTDPKTIIAAIHSQENQVTGREPVGSTGVAIFDQTPCAASTGGCGWHAANDQGLKELQLWLTLYQNEESLEIFRDWNLHLDTLSALQQLAQWLSGVPGRKTLVWAGSGVQLYGGITRVAAGSGPRRDYSRIDFRSAGQAMDANAYTFNLLSAANVAVYPLDARHGANTSFAVFDASRTDAPIGQGAFSGQKGRVQNENEEIIAMFQQIAASTGGKACFNRTDLSNCLKEFAADSRDYYMMGFYVDKNTKPGWHALSVKLDQKADLRHRTGFMFDVPGFGKPQPGDFQLALSSLLPYTDVQIRGRFISVEGADAKRLVRYELNLPAQSIALGEQGNALKLDVTTVVRGTDGKEVANLSQHIDRTLEPQQAALIRREGIHYTNRLELPPGSYGVWFAVRDSNTGRTGSVITKLTVQ
ncbi:MAG: VWA domain-containing protein [Candidatus Acidiferrum sp.]